MGHRFQHVLGKKSSDQLVSAVKYQLVSAHLERDSVALEVRTKIDALGKAESLWFYNVHDEV